MKRGGPDGSRTRVRGFADRDLTVRTRDRGWTTTPLANVFANALAGDIAASPPVSPTGVEPVFLASEASALSAVLRGGAQRWRRPPGVEPATPWVATRWCFTGPESNRIASPLVKSYAFTVDVGGLEPPMPKGGGFTDRWATVAHHILGCLPRVELGPLEPQSSVQNPYTIDTVLALRLELRIFRV